MDYTSPITELMAYFLLGLFRIGFISMTILVPLYAFASYMSFRRIRTK